MKMKELLEKIVRKTIIPIATAASLYAAPAMAATFVDSDKEVKTNNDFMIFSRGSAPGIQANLFDASPSIYDGRTPTEFNVQKLKLTKGKAPQVIESYKVTMKDDKYFKLDGTELKLGDLQPNELLTFYAKRIMTFGPQGTFILDHNSPIYQMHPAEIDKPKASKNYGFFGWVQELDYPSKTGKRGPEYAFIGRELKTDNQIGPIPLTADEVSKLEKSVTLLSSNLQANKELINDAACVADLSKHYGLKDVQGVQLINQNLNPEYEVGDSIGFLANGDVAVKQIDPEAKDILVKYFGASNIGDGTKGTPFFLTGPSALGGAYMFAPVAGTSLATSSNMAKTAMPENKSGTAKK